MALLAQMPPVQMTPAQLQPFGARWTALDNRLSRTPPQSSSQLGRVFDEAVGHCLATMLGGIPVVTHNDDKTLLPPQPDCVEVGPVRIVGGIRPQNFDVGYRPDGVRFAFDSKTLNDTESVGKNYQNMINDLATEAATVHTRYPVAPSRELQANALVRTCAAEWSYNDAVPQRIPLSGIPTIEITPDAWKEVVDRFKTGEGVPPYVSFALDAAYFSTSDPIRAIVMACAAWEVALRSYLANVASKRDPAYLIASQGGNIPRLYSFARAAKGGPVFHDQHTHPGLEPFVRRQADLIQKLPSIRNKLLHEGEMSTAADVAEDAALIVLNAIEWLFR